MMYIYVLYNITLLGKGVGDPKVCLVEFENLGSFLEGVLCVVEDVRVGTHADLMVGEREPTVT